MTAPVPEPIDANEEDARFSKRGMQSVVFAFVALVLPLLNISLVVLMKTAKMRFLPVLYILPYMAFFLIPVSLSLASPFRTSRQKIAAVIALIAALVAWWTPAL